MNKQTDIKIRNSSIELLRLVCMMFIIMHHIIITTIAPNFSNQIYNFFDTIFHTAVVIFVIITGYFGISFKFGKLIRLWTQIACYSVSAGLIAFFILKTICLKELFDCALPIYRKPYWFMTSYIGLFLISPALNVVTQDFNQKQLFLLIVILLYSTNAYPPDLVFGSGLVLMSLLYLIGRYLGNYKKESYKSNKWLLTALVGGGLIIAPFYFLHPNSLLFQKFITVFYRYYGIGTITLSIIIFLLFRNMSFSSKIVNYFASSSLAIYLIHENHLISHYTYELPVLYLITFMPSYMAMILVALLLMLLCVLIDKVRILVFRHIEPLFMGAENLYKKAYIKLDKIL